MLYVWQLEEFFFNIYDLLADEHSSTDSAGMHGVHFLNHSPKSFGDNLATKSDTKYLDVLVVLVDVFNEATQQRDPGQVAVD